MIYIYNIHLLVVLTAFMYFFFILFFHSDEDNCSRTASRLSVARSSRASRFTFARRTRKVFGSTSWRSSRFLDAEAEEQAHMLIQSKSFGKVHGGAAEVQANHRLR